MNRNNQEEPTGRDRTRLDRLVREARSHTGVGDAQRDGWEIVVWIDDRTTIPDSFRQWADEQDLIIRDVVVFPDEDSFSLQLAFASAVFDEE